MMNWIWFGIGLVLIILGAASVENNGLVGSAVLLLVGTGIMILGIIKASQESEYDNR